MKTIDSNKTLNLFIVIVKLLMMHRASDEKSLVLIKILNRQPRNKCYIASSIFKECI